MEVSEAATPAEPSDEQVRSISGAQGDETKQRSDADLPEEPASTQEKAAYLVARAFGSEEGSRATSRARDTNKDVAVDLKDCVDAEPPQIDSPLPDAAESAREVPEEVPTMEQPNDPEAVEDVWGFSTKKSKKDKKKLQQTFNDLPTERTSGDLAQPQDETAAETESRPEESLEGLTIEQILHPSSSRDVDMIEPAQTDDFSWAPTKKSKKDKRKKRQSTLDENEPVESGSATPAVVMDNEAPQTLPERRSVDEVLSDPAARQSSNASKLADLPSSPVKLKSFDDHDFPQAQRDVEPGQGPMEDDQMPQSVAPRDISHPVTVDLGQLQSASARDHHEAQQHQNFLAGASYEGCRIPF